MKIGFDAKRAFLNRTGLGNYSRWLINTLSEFQPDNLYFLYTPRTDPKISFPKSNTNLITKLPVSSFATWLWRSRGIVKDLKRDQIQLYHGLSHELPWSIKQSGIKSVLTVHDLIFMRFPQYFKAVDRIIYKVKLKYACRAADKIIAISQRTKNDLVEFLHVDPAKIEVIYQGCDHTFTIKQTAAQKQLVKEKYKLPHQFLLNVGTIERRKNLLLTVKALISIPDIKLVVVGKPTAYLNEIKTFINQHNLTARVIFLHNVTFQELPVLYQLATCFIYPSRYEGFGIPILEALNSGVPVIAAKGSCLEEAGGPGSLYIDPDNEHDCAEKIIQVLTNQQLRQNMITEGLTYSRNFDHHKLAQHHADLYQNILNNA